MSFILWKKPYRLIGQPNKWYCAVFVLLWLISHNVLKVHPCCPKWLDNIWAREGGRGRERSHILFIHLFINRHVSGFWALAAVNNAAWTWDCRYLFKGPLQILFSFPLNKYPRAGFLDHLVVLFSIFWGTFIMFSIVAEPICISTNSVQGFTFLYVLTNTYLLSRSLPPCVFF